MLEKMIEMIEKNASSMAEDLKERLLNNPDTKSFQTLDDKALYEDIRALYSRLGYWLMRDPEKGDVRSYYTELGKRRRMDGFSLSELVRSLILMKRHIWDTVLQKGIMDAPVELNSGIDLITYLNRFFDFAIYYTTLGYYKSLGVNLT